MSVDEVIGGCERDYRMGTDFHNGLSVPILAGEQRGEYDDGGSNSASTSAYQPLRGVFRDKTDSEHLAASRHPPTSTISSISLEQNQQAIDHSRSMDPA